jgi:diguanylate cyclase (GGDEF)-like protein
VALRHSFFFRSLLASALSALLIAVCGGSSGFWLSVPIVLLLAASARTLAQASLGASAVTVAGIAVAGSSAPPLLLILLVTGGCVAVIRVQHERFERERRSLQSSAMKDPLTGAANRRAFAERIRYEVARHARQEHEFAVVALDLDGFKAVNDRFGHQAGDDLLRQVAEALALAVREQDTVARVGGDEFYVLAPETDRVGGERLELRVRQAISGVTTGVESLSASVGVALFPEDATSAAGLVEFADAEAMNAKRLAQQPASVVAAA